MTLIIYIMVTQSTKPEDLVGEILLDYNGEVFNKLKKPLGENLLVNFSDDGFAKKMGKSETELFPRDSSISKFSLVRITRLMYSRRLK